MGDGREFCCSNWWIWAEFPVRNNSFSLERRRQMQQHARLVVHSSKEVKSKGFEKCPRASLRGEIAAPA